MSSEMGNHTSTDNFILTRDFWDEHGQKYWAKFDTQHFESGVSRFAFKGTLRGSGPKKEKQCVVKVFKEEYAKRFEDWVPDLYTSITARDLTVKFMKEVVPLLQLREMITIDFVVPMLAKVDESTMNTVKNERKNTTIDKQEYVAIEEYIDGKYVKFNSNAGYEDISLSDIMPAFTHWTWIQSNNKLMVCDLQGVKNKVEDGYHYILTDPAINSVGETFGMTDLGVAGMYRVLTSHTCTDICKQLGLKNPIKEYVRLLRGQPRGTTYNFDLTDSEKKMNEMERRH